MKINIKGDMKNARRVLGRLERQVPFATSVAMNRSAAKIQRFEKTMIRRDLDNPTPQVVKSIRVKRASKRDLEAAVFIIPAIAEFLRFQIDGGTRAPRGQVEAVPVNARLNRYGNIPGRRQGKIAKLIARPDTFVGEINGVAGVWRRKRPRSAGLELLLAFERSVRYRPKFPFFRYAEVTLERVWVREFNRAIVFATKTAR